MAVKTYLTIRPLLWEGRWITPKHLLSKSFTGMDVSFEQLVWDPQTDGRMLLELVADTDEHMDALVEALQWFGRHQKTLASAAAFAGWSYTGTGTDERCAENEGLVRPTRDPMP